MAKLKTQKSSGIKYENFEDFFAETQIAERMSAGGKGIPGIRQDFMANGKFRNKSSDLTNI